MSWADIKRKYANGGASASQSTEDMAARRILRAMGLSEKTLPAAEKAAGLAETRQADTTLLERTTALADAFGALVLRRLPPVRDVRNQREAENAVLELGEQNKGRADLVYRVHGDDRLMGVVRLSSLLVDTDNMPMPCRMTRSRDGTAVLLWCDAQTLYSKLLKPEAQNG